jgi:hypothetical protein
MTPWALLRNSVRIRRLIGQEAIGGQFRGSNDALAQVGKEVVRRGAISFACAIGDDRGDDDASATKVYWSPTSGLSDRATRRCFFPVVSDLFSMGMEVLVRFDVGSQEEEWQRRRNAARH